MPGLLAMAAARYIMAVSDRYTISGLGRQSPQGPCRESREERFCRRRHARLAADGHGGGCRHHGRRAGVCQPGQRPMGAVVRGTDGRRGQCAAAGGVVPGRWHLGGCGAGCRDAQARRMLGDGADRAGRRGIYGGGPAAVHPGAVRGRAVRRAVRRPGGVARPGHGAGRYGAAGGGRLPGGAVRPGAPGAGCDVGDGGVERVVRVVARPAVGGAGG